MHPDLQAIAAELKACAPDDVVPWRFALSCVEEVEVNLESEEVIAVLQRFRDGLAQNHPNPMQWLAPLSQLMASLAASHPGSRSIDGTRHAAVSATHALAKAVSGQALEAAAYAAYSCVYGYGSYAVSDPAAFAEVHRRQLRRLRELKQAGSRVAAAPAEQVPRSDGRGTATDLAC